MLRAEDELPYAIAHRGYSAVAPENTLVASEAARLAGVRAIELDVTDTADGVPIMWHDPTVDAKTDGSGRVDELTLSKVRRLDAGSWFSPAYQGTPIATWEETLDLLRGRDVELIIDQKVADVSATLKPVLDRGMAADVVFASLSVAKVAEAREIAPDVRRGLITSRLHADPIEVAQKLGLSAYSVRADRVIDQPAPVADLRAAGVAVVVWTVNDPGHWLTLIDIGVDGIITDRVGEYVGFRTAGRRRSSMNAGKSRGYQDDRAAQQ
jgi:glycerophosphoryl diester phosphodiesterase